MKSPSPDSLKMLESLRIAVKKALEKKKRLGQYAVIWKDGRPVILHWDSKSRQGPSERKN